MPATGDVRRIRREYAWLAWPEIVDNFRTWQNARRAIERAPCVLVDFNLFPSMLPSHHEKPRAEWYWHVVVRLGEEECDDECEDK